MFSKQNVFFNVISIMVVGIVILLLTLRQRVVVPQSDPPVVNVVPHDKPAKHPTLPKNSPFRAFVPQILKMASSKFREPAQLGRLLTKVLIEYGLTDKPLPPDKTEALPPLVTAKEWDYQDDFSDSYGLIESFNAIHKNSENLTEVEHQFYVQIMTTIGKQSPITFTRFAAAMFLADSAITNLDAYDDLPEKIPASLEDARQCYDSAFVLLLDRAESMSNHELKMNLLCLVSGYVHYFLMVEALSSAETTEKGIQRALNIRMKDIIDKFELVASRTKSPKRRKILNGLPQFLKERSSQIIPGAAVRAYVTKQVRPFVESFIAAVNDEDFEAMLKHYLISKPQSITQLKNMLKNKSLRDEFSGTKNTTSLRLLDIGSDVLGCKDMFEKEVFPIPNKEVFSITLYLAATDSKGVTKTVQVKYYWGKQNGQWKIVYRNE